MQISIQTKGEKNTENLQPLNYDPKSVRETDSHTTLHEALRNQQVQQKQHTHKNLILI